MSISKFIKRNLSSIQRSNRKKQVLRTVASSDQNNYGITNVYRMDSNNVGDYYCAPHLYFNDLNCNPVDIYDYKSNDKSVADKWVESINNNALIIGGGGLLNRGSFEKQLKLFESLKSKGKKTVLWGTGHNEKDKSRFGKVRSYNINVNNFGLVGVRDFGFTKKWVPCVSCMHKVFDKEYLVSQEIGLLYHKKTLKNKSLIKKLSQYPSSSNTTNLEEMIDFIGKSETIVTDSYHCMYWSMILGKKVIVIPNSSKFYDFKYKPVFATFSDFDTKLKMTQCYSGVLEECREQNKEFAKRVMDYLN